MSILKICFEQIKKSGFVDLGLGVAFDETVTNKNDHAIPVLLIPGRYLNPSKKQKKRKKRTLSTYFPPNPYFLPDIPCFYFEDRRKKKND